MNPTQLARRLALVAGLADLASGLGLAVAPGLALGSVGLPGPGTEAQVFVRFLGVFVAAVGAVYLWALQRPVERLRVTLGATTLFRLAAGSYAAVAVAAGWLHAAWSAVAWIDYALAAVQTWLLAKGAGRDA